MSIEKHFDPVQDSFGRDLMMCKHCKYVYGTLPENLEAHLTLCVGDDDEGHVLPPSA